MLLVFPEPKYGLWGKSSSSWDCGLSLLLAALTMVDLSTLLPFPLVDDTVEHLHM